LKRSLIWHRDLVRRARCPACGYHGDTKLLLETESTIEPYDLVTFATCSICSCIFQLNFIEPEYSTYNASPAALKFYVEQGAGLETLILPACIARTRLTRRYLEVGCGLGFGLDFARYTFGWDVRGIDPSPLAAEGRRLFNLHVESRYFTRTDAEGQPAYDCVAALEVLEHVPTPDEFLAALRLSLRPDGILILSTPHAGYIEFGVEKPGLLSVLTPGYHAVLYSPKSITLALRKAGFPDSQAITRGATLIAVAGKGASVLDLDNAFAPELYRAYLESRLSMAQPGSILETGFAYRLFKYLVNNGLYDEADIMIHRLAETLLRHYGIDVLNPHKLLADEARAGSFDDFISRLPACITGILYFNAMLRLNHAQDRGGALAFFYAAHVMAGIFRMVMSDVGIDDGETADLERSARDHIKIVLGWISQ
jgi:2-polyprenyl-3-methyl-5-hydroxy-6-metoxy-1,4-benzoquinol methylase